VTLRSANPGIGFGVAIWQDRDVARKQKLIFGFMILVGLVLLSSAFIIGNSGNDDDSVLNNPAVDALIPNRGDEVLQQQTVGIDLAAGYRLVRLTISANANCTLPVDVTSNTRYVEGLQQFLFTPGQGKPIESLAADFNCAEAVFEEIAQPGNVDRIEWAFTVN